MHESLDADEEGGLVEVSDRPRRARGRAFTVAFLAALFFLGWRAWNSAANLFNDPFNDWSFDRSTWAEQPDHRGRMFDSLRDRLLQDRPSRDQIRELLGQPDDRMRKSDDRCWSYYIGSWSGLRIDTDAVYVVFSLQGHVEDVGRVQY